MLEFLKKRLADEHGGIDSIIVALLFVIVAVAGLVGFSIWSTENKNTLEMQAVMQIDKILEDNAPAASVNLTNESELEQYTIDAEIYEVLTPED